MPPASASPVPPRSPLKTGLILLIVVVALMAALIWLRPKPDEAPQRGRRNWSEMTMPVRVAEALREPFALQLKALGTVTALNTVTVRSRVDGELIRVLFREGQVVEEGELLAEIDPRPYQVRLAQAEGLQKQHLAELESARIDLQRFLDLQAKGFVSAQQLSNQQALVRQYEARRQSDQATVDDARLQLGYTRISAPIAGRVGLRNVDVGNLVGAGNAEGLVTITQADPISVLFTVTENDLPALLDAVRRDPELPVEAWDRDERRMLARGTLSSLDNRIDTSTGTLRLRATFDNAQRVLFPNQFVNVRLVLRADEALVIPNAAVQFGSQGTFVFIVDADNRISLRPLTLGTSSGERIEVLDGLAAGERVVVEGLDRLREGSTVNVVADAASPAAVE
ncbi:MAG: MdtA/MuxA family multidrug efflux RND transporter periplasmic adaptor subunit [Lysobacteraceae bacterium]